MSTHPMSLPPPQVRRAALAVPVFHKIWLAGVGAVLAAVVVTGVAVANASLPSAARTAFVAGLAGFGAMMVHALLVRLALRPIDELAHAAERIARGEEAARAPLSPLADPRTARIIDVFNHALDEVADERRRLRDLAARAREMHEADRLRTAQALHESAAQTLATLLVRLQVARRVTDAERRDAALEAMRTDIAEAAEAVQRIAFSLRPPAISEVGAGVAIASYVREACEAAGIAHRCDLADIGPELGAPAATVLFRVVQEAVDNAIRHAAPSRIVVATRMDGAEIEATIQDDGRGFPVEAVLERGRCLGLFEMEERADRIGGLVTLTSRPGAGTTVRVRIPVAAA